VGIGETMDTHLFRAFSQPAPFHNVLAFSRLAHSKSVELPHNERDYTGNVRAEQENIANVAIISRPGLGPLTGGLASRRAGTGREKAEDEDDGCRQALLPTTFFLVQVVQAIQVVRVCLRGWRRGAAHPLPSRACRVDRPKNE
jgi:hypothetical protein